MLSRFARIGMVVVVLAVALLASRIAPPAYAAGNTSVVESVVHEADISGVIDLIQQALVDYHGLSLDDQEVVYSAIGRTTRAIDYLYDTGATGDLFNTAEDLLLTQLDFLHEVEFATVSEDIDDLNGVATMLVDLAQRRLAFERQMGNAFTPLAVAHSVSVVDIARNDTAARTAMARLITALASGRPVDLDISDEVYRALGETARGLDLVDETFETGDVFDTAVGLLEHRFQFLVDLEEAVISGDLDDLRLVAEDWVRLSQQQLVFERQLAAREVSRASRDFLSNRRAGFFNRFSRSSRENSEVATHDDTQISEARNLTQVVTVQRGDTLVSIAERYGTTIDRLAQLNNIADPNKIDQGMLLVVPAVAAEATQ